MVGTRGVFTGFKVQANRVTAGSCLNWGLPQHRGYAFNARRGICRARDCDPYGTARLNGSPRPCCDVDGRAIIRGGGQSTKGPSLVLTRIMGMANPMVRDRIKA